MILSLVAKSKLPILVYILSYEVWLWGQNHGFSRVLCISGLNKLILSTYTRFCLALRVWVMKMKPIVVHYGIGHRLLRSKGIFEIREFFMPKSSKIQPNFMNFKNTLPPLQTCSRVFLWTNFIIISKISKIWRGVFD